jgi:uncharacterized protein
MDAVLRTELERYREKRDAFFRAHPRSPLTADQRRVFQGLRYFPEDRALQLVVPLEPYAEKQTVVLQTSTGEHQPFVRYGRLRFRVAGQEVALSLYANSDHFFLPFVDALAGSETFSVGRYLDPEPLPHRRFLLDFNRAYNPACAYNPAWSCPVTPPENWLPVPIRAGERLFGVPSEAPGAPEQVMVRETC